MRFSVKLKFFIFIKEASVSFVCFYFDMNEDLVLLQKARLVFFHGNNIFKGTYTDNLQLE